MKPISAVDVNAKKNAHYYVKANSVFKLLVYINRDTCYYCNNKKDKADYCKVVCSRPICK